MVEMISNLNLFKNKLQGKLNECVVTDGKIKTFPKKETY